MPGSNPIERHFKKVTGYHIYFFSLFFLSKFLSVWHTLNMIFLSPPMEYTCASNSGNNLTLNQCPCDNPIWDHSIFTKTVQTKYGIICGQVWLISMTESVYFFGLLVGALIFGMLSDRYGRLYVYSICQFVIGSAGCLVTVMPNIASYSVMRFLEGVGSGGAIVSGFVLCVEFCGSSYRATISSLVHIPSNVGLIALAGISYSLRNCDHFQLAISVPVFLFVSLKCLLLESPKWLLDHNKKEETVKVMEKFCRFNKSPYDTIKQDIEVYQASRTIDDMKKMKFYYIFRHRYHVKNFLCMSYLYFVCGLCYYGVAQFIGKMSIRVHENTAINGTLVLLGTITCIILINRVGRRRFMRTTLLLAGIFILIVIAVPVDFKPHWVRIMFACFSSSLYYVSFTIVFLYGVELFPTNIRSSILGILSLTSRVGQVLGPIINGLSLTAAGIVFGVLAIVGSIVTFCLPETKSTILPSTLEGYHVRFDDKVRSVSPESEKFPEDVKSSQANTAEASSKSS